MAIDVQAIEEHIRGILIALGDDPEREGLKDTPKRVAKMYEDIYKGMCYTNDEIAGMLNTTFEDDLALGNAENDLVFMKDIEIFSHCEHHLALMYNISAEFAWSLDQRSLPDRARSAVFSSIPDAILVSGVITGEAAALSDLEAVKRVVPDVPVLANTGVKHQTVADVLKIADGCVVGSSLKVDGNTWNAVDAERAKDFMDRARKARGE